MLSTDHEQTLMYADDLSLFTLAGDINLAASRLQRSITKINNWLCEQGFLLSVEKSVYMMFTRKRVTIPPPLSINRQNVKYVTKHKFLGLIFDGPHLNWTHHINYLKVCYNRKLAAIKALTSVI